MAVCDVNNYCDLNEMHIFLVMSDSFSLVSVTLDLTSTRNYSINSTEKY